MKNYDEKIKAKEEMIVKLQKEIDERKSKISKLQSEVKTLQAERNEEFGRDIMQKLVSLGLNSEADRKAILEKLESLAIERGIEKSEKTVQTETPTSEENPKTEPSPTTPILQNLQNSQSPQNSSVQNFKEKSNL